MLSLAKDRYLILISPPPYQILIAAFQATFTSRVLLRLGLINLLPDMLTVGSPLNSETVRFRLGSISRLSRGRVPDRENLSVSGFPKVYICYHI